MQTLPQTVFSENSYSGVEIPPLGGHKFRQWITFDSCRSHIKTVWSCNAYETNIMIYEKLTADIAADLNFPNASAAFLPERHHAGEYNSLSFLSVEPFKNSSSLYDLFYGEANGKPSDTDNFLTAMKHHPEIIADFVRLASCDLWVGNEDRHSANIVMSLKSESGQRQICGIDPVDPHFANHMSTECWRSQQAQALCQIEPAQRDHSLDEATSAIEAYPDERIYTLATRLNQLGHKDWNGEHVANVLMARKRMLRAKMAHLLQS